MTKFSSHLHGEPCWLDCSVSSTAEREALITFYSELFGWTFEVGSAQTGFYSTAHLDGAPILGIGEQPGGEGKWVTYFATDDIEDSQRLIKGHGGEVFLPAMTVMDLGSMALALDATGAVHGLWQSGSFAGFGAKYEFGAPGWFDHVSGDTSRALEYYTSVLGKDVQLHSEAGLIALRHGAQLFASLTPNPSNEPGAYWTPLIVVGSLAASKEKVRALGGRIIIEEQQVPGSFISVFEEPVMRQQFTIVGQR